MAERPRAQLLLGGLGMGYTLRATLDQLPRTARVTVVELTGVVDWCRGPLAVLSGQALADRRVKAVVRDVSRVIGARRPPDSYDAIVLDLYEGPHQATNKARDPLYGREALERAFTVLRARGVLAIWSEEPDRAFESRLEAAGFEVQRHPGGRGGRAHTIYLGIRPSPSRRPPPRR